MFPELVTDRLLLQEINPQDQAFIYEGLSHPDVIPFYGVQFHSFEATSEQMEWYQKITDENSGTPWKIVNKATGENIGVLAIYFHKPEHNRAEVGFWLLPAFWHKGFALEALYAAIYYWKTEKGLHRLEAFVEEGNLASSRLLQKGGFQYEGTMRDYEMKNGRYISVQIFSLLLTS